MSYDRQLDQICEHRVVEETLYVNFDQRTIRPLRPIASMDSVIVRINGAMTVPTYGLYAPARIVGAKTEPFTVRSGVNDLLLLQVGAGAIQMLKMSPGVGLSAKHIADVLNLQASGVLFEAHDRHVAMRSVLEGRGATMVF